MHLHKKIFIGLFLISFYFISESKAIANDILSFNNVEELNLVLNDFSDEKFSHYLKSMNNYDLEEHKTAIRNLFNLYRKDYVKLEACTVKESGLRKEYSDNWLKGLKTKYGSDYVEKHVESIKSLLINLFNQPQFSKPFNVINAVFDHGDETFKGYRSIR